MTDTIVLIFSKDRALQLDATLRSFLLHCKDAEAFSIRVLYTVSSEFHEQQYTRLEEEYREHSFIRFSREFNFRTDVLALLAPFDYVLFLVDDNIFVRDFILRDANQQLSESPSALGFSLRLGTNTTYCYPLRKNQKLPEFRKTGKDILGYDWTRAEFDFGYPLEVSSSLYRCGEIVPFLAALPFNNPNTMEAAMAANSNHFAQDRPRLLCYPHSVTFCAPLNMVQNCWANRASTDPAYSPGNLAELFFSGHRVDVRSYSDFLPTACHQEIQLKLQGPDRRTSATQIFTSVMEQTPPLVSIIIPCYNQSQYLPDAVESVVGQAYENWECIIVNDGSTDDTSTVARELIAKFPGKNIILLEKENGGLADARNFGIRRSKGNFILPLDADDALLPEMLEKTVPVLVSDGGIGIVYTDAVHFKDGTNNFRVIPFRDYDPKEIFTHNCFSYCALFRREAFEVAAGYNTNMVWGYEDWDFWLGCISMGFNIRRVPVPLFLYRVKETSMITNAVQHDAELKARIILNHPSSFSPVQIAWAEGVLAQNPDILSLPHPEGVIPDAHYWNSAGQLSPDTPRIPSVLMPEA